MTRQPTPGVHQNFAEEPDMQDKASVTVKPAALWRYDIQYGPDGETNYAWVYCGAEMVATMRTYNAKRICDGMNAALSVEKAPAVETPAPSTHVVGIGDEEIIERMAKAMCECHGFPWHAAGHWETGAGDEPEEQRMFWRDKAEAALLAFRTLIPAPVSRAVGSDDTLRSEEEATR